MMHSVNAVAAGTATSGDWTKASKQACSRMSSLRDTRSSSSQGGNSLDGQQSPPRRAKMDRNSAITRTATRFSCVSGTHGRTMPSIRLARPSFARTVAPGWRVSHWSPRTSTSRTFERPSIACSRRIRCRGLLTIRAIDPLAQAATSIVESIRSRPSHLSATRYASTRRRVSLTDTGTGVERSGSISAMRQKRSCSESSARPCATPASAPSAASTSSTFRSGTGLPQGPSPCARASEIATSEVRSRTMRMSFRLLIRWLRRPRDSPRCTR